MIGSHNTDIDVAFYNDRVKEIIPASSIAEPFTYVPIVAGHMELVGGNAVVFGKITEGYDVVEANIEVELSYENVSLRSPRTDLALTFHQIGTTIANSVAPVWNDFTQYYKGDVVTYNAYYYACIATSPIGQIPESSGVGDPANLYWYQLGRVGEMTFRKIVGVAVVTIPDIIVEGSSYNITVENDSEGIANMTASYTAAPGDIYTTVVGGLIVDLNARGFEYVGVSADGHSIWIYTRYRLFKQTPTLEAGDVTTVFKDFYFAAYILSYGNTVTFPILKCGATHAFGIVYKDRAGRCCSVIKTPIFTVYIPFYSEDSNNLFETIAKLVFKINHKPPSWAESYEIVYFGNVSMDYFLQMRANNITALAGAVNRFSLNIADTIVWTQTQNNRWRVPPYDWLAGDRLRLMGIINQTTYYGEAIGGGFVYDYEIEATGTQYDEEPIGGDWLIFQATHRPNLFVNETNILVEVYRPRKGLSQTVAYGTGMVFDIATDVFGNRYHKGDVDQSFDANGVCIVAAEVNNTANDSWKYYRLNYKFESTEIQPFWAESMFPSDWWRDQIVTNRLTSIGFPFLDDLSQRQRVLDERIRHGGFLITGTRTNNIAHFTFDDFMDLPKRNGDITGLREVGYTLKVIQMYKETSIYINRIQTFNPDGTEQFTLTDKFLAEQRPMESDYGCQHPDSIMVNGRNLYYWDHSQGKFIRSAPNGQIVLDIKMKRWFKDLIKWIQANGGGKTLETRTGANNEHDEIWLTFRMGDEVRGVIFSEKQGRYISRINQITESYVHLGNFFAHLYHQRVWIMNVDEGQDYLSWVGVPTYAEIEVVSNIEPVRNKVYNAIALFADHELSSLPKYIYIPAEASAGNNLMESNVSIWDRVEGVFYGEILKDENSKGNFVSLNDRKMNGNAMRGRYCFVKLYTEEHDDKVRIDSIVIFSTPSERNV